LQPLGGRPVQVRRCAPVDIPESSGSTWFAAKPEVTFSSAASLKRDAGVFLASRKIAKAFVDLSNPGKG
jgi:hypothetical protein